MTATSLQGAFTDAPVQSARAFREILEALARPGCIRSLTGGNPPVPLSVAAGVVLLTLTDSTTPLHLAGRANCQTVREWVAFHIGAPLVPATDAQFALGRWQDLQPLDRFRIGQPDFPDRSATLIIEMDRLAAEGHRLTGPGIRTSARLSLPEAEAFRANRSLFPLGLDCLFTSGTQIAGLPRSTKVETA